MGIYWKSILPIFSHRESFSLRENHFVRQGGEEIFGHKFPIDRSSMSRFRERLKKKKLYKLLQETIKSGFKTKLLKPKSIEKAIIDSTVQEKNISYPTDAKLYYKAITLLSK